MCKFTCNIVYGIPNISCEQSGLTGPGGQVSIELVGWVTALRIPRLSKKKLFILTNRPLSSTQRMDEQINISKLISKVKGQLKIQHMLYWMIKFYVSHLLHFLLNFPSSSFSIDHACYIHQFIGSGIHRQYKAYIYIMFKQKRGIYTSLPIL